jgi:M6 family metalloprotease-like protein
VDFPDLQSPTSEAPSFSTLKNDFEAYYQAQSNGKMKFVWTVAPKFTRMSKNISGYGVGSRAAGDVWKLNFDIQDLAFQSYKREDFDFIIGSAPTTTRREDIASSPAFGSNSPNYLPGTYLGGDYWSNGLSTTIPTHEFGHFALGLADLYDFNASMLGEAGFEKQFQYMGVFDLMNWAGGVGLELTSWNRWIGRLISDNQMLCLPNSPTTTLLKPIGNPSDDVKGLVIPLSNSSSIVIENRAAVGFDRRLPDSAEGILVYVVDTTIGTGKGPMRIVRKVGSTDNLFRDASLKNGESLIHSGFLIKVVGSVEKNLYVEVQKVS